MKRINAIAFLLITVVGVSNANIQSAIAEDNYKIKSPSNANKNSNLISQSNSGVSAGSPTSSFPATPGNINLISPNQGEGNKGVLLNPSLNNTSSLNAQGISPVINAQNKPVGSPNPAIYGIDVVGASENVPLELPSVQQLLPVGGKLPPIRLEANFTRPISLRDALRFALDYNLAIRISEMSVSSQKWLFYGSLGNFLPNVLMTYRQQILSGSSLVSGVIPVSFHTPNINTFVTFQQYVFQGGKVLFGALTAKNTYKAAKANLTTSIHDTMLLITQNYYNLVLNQALLQIQVKQVETDRVQLKLNQQLEKGGVGTHFNVLQSETQLATDEQNLLSQEVQTRLAAVQLATNLNMNLAMNLIPIESDVRKVRLIDPSLDINDLTRIAIQNRPELRTFNYLRIAALRNIQVNAAPLYPSMYLFSTVTGTGQTLTHQKELVEGAFQPLPVNSPAPGSVIGTANGAIGQAGGVGSGQGGTLTGVADSYVPAHYTSRELRKSTALGFEIDWNYYGLGIPNVGNTESAKALARQSMLQFNQELITILQQVRQSYLNSEIAERQIEVASRQVISSTEQLRLASVRLANGVGTNIDLISAQQAWVQARTSKVNAIIQFNLSQAQLLHDIGVISYDTLTSGRLVRQ